MPDGQTPGIETLLEFEDNRLVRDLCGPHNAYLAQIESFLGVQILQRGNVLALHGDEVGRGRADEALRALYLRLQQGRPVEPGDVDAALRFGAEEAQAPSPEPDAPSPENQLEMFAGGRLAIRTRKKTVEPRTPAQRGYVRALFEKSLVFGLGPAGTGKTWTTLQLLLELLEAYEQ
ncbi:MAG: PhoH family protein, partial [Pseudomonadota bacterium]